ncbi:MAG: branched-chain amino acid ABC transporter permease [Ruminococcaceae bacterium]|nr:branched-chain amino acid ABC transporter permease [Oscillospiraceae bacterium]
MYITANTIITAGAVIGALGSIFALIFSLYRRYLNQNKQADEIKRIKDEQTLIFYALLACLDGLQQLGANHTVPEMKGKLERHLNENAHK